jgi:hypothetical protein
LQKPPSGGFFVGVLLYDARRFAGNPQVTIKDGDDD